jgi:hypothetical protein
MTKRIQRTGEDRDTNLGSGICIPTIGASDFALDRIHIERSEYRGSTFQTDANTRSGALDILYRTDVTLSRC